MILDIFDFIAGIDVIVWPFKMLWRLVRWITRRIGGNRNRQASQR